MDVVGVMAAYLPGVRVCIAQSVSASLDSAVHTVPLYTAQYTQCLSRQCSTHSASLYSAVHTVPL